MPAGRPLKFQTVEELESAIEAYFESVKKPQMIEGNILFEPVTITGLAIALDTKLIKDLMPKMLSQHDTKQVIGVWQQLSEDSKGLIVKGTFANTTAGNDHYELAKMGAIDAMSIGYSVDDAAERKDGVRELKAVTLYEVSLVTFPANEKAIITSVKNKPTLRELEQHLRDVGLSHSEAKALLAHGYKAKHDHRDVEPGLAALNTLLNQFTKELSL